MPLNRRLDGWLKTALDEPRIDSYAVCVAVENKKILKQVANWLSATY